MHGCISACIFVLVTKIDFPIQRSTPVKSRNPKKHIVIDPRLHSKLKRRKGIRKLNAYAQHLIELGIELENIRTAK